MNVRRAFVCDADVPVKRIAAMDDVLTTGATLNEFAQAGRRGLRAAPGGWADASRLKRDA